MKKLGIMVSVTVAVGALALGGCKLGGSDHDSATSTKNVAGSPLSVAEKQFKKVKTSKNQKNNPNTLPADMSKQGTVAPASTGSANAMPANKATTAPATAAPAAVPATKAAPETKKEATPVTISTSAGSVSITPVKPVSATTTSASGADAAQ